MKIDVWSDIACPYCCIGGIRLKKALRELDCEELFEIVPRSFQLEPELAGPGRPALRHYADKMGVEIEDLQEGLDRIVALAAGEGLEFCFDRVLAANTFDAHRLVKHAQALGVPNMTERLFEACFRDGLDVGDHAVLAGLAADAGLDPEHARAMLASDAWTAEVVADMAEARARAGKNGVEIRFEHADFRALSETFTERFDLVIAMDNALPHMLTKEALGEAVRSIVGQLRPGGVFVASIRDYDSLLTNKPPYSPPYIHRTDSGQRVSFQTWVWKEENYRLTQYLIDDEGTLRVSKFECEYRATRREELTELLSSAGCRRVQWEYPESTGFYQPIVVAEK